MSAVADCFRCELTPLQQDGKQKSFGFYFPKVIVVALFWISGNVVYSWFSYVLSNNFLISSFHHFIISSSHHLIISSSHHLIISSSHHLIISSSHHLIISSSHHLIILSFLLLNIIFIYYPCSLHQILDPVYSTDISANPGFVVCTMHPLEDSRSIYPLSLSSIHSITYSVTLSSPR